MTKQEFVDAVADEAGLEGGSLRAARLGAYAGGAWAAATPFSNAVRKMIPKQNLIV